MKQHRPNPHAQALGRLGGSVQSPAKGEANRRRFAAMTEPERRAWKEKISRGCKQAWEIRHQQAINQH